MDTLKRFAGPAITLAILLTIYWLPGLGTTAALSFVPLVWAVYTGGLCPGVASAAIIIGYSAYTYPPDYARFAQVALATIAITFMVSELKRRARLAETLNGNLARLKEAVKLTRELKNEWADLSDAGRYKKVELIEDLLGNLAMLVLGWISIGQKMKEAKMAVGMKPETVTETEEDNDDH